MNEDLHIFREGRRRVSGKVLLQEMSDSLGHADNEAVWTDALLRAGALECALADQQAPESRAAAALTDACGELLVNADFERRPELLRDLPESVPEQLTVSTPEGFAYYGLHPMQYAEAIERITEIRDAVVVGIRSIGTTLSAVTLAALRRRGVRAERFTVRPEGHPFDRVVHWDERQRRVVREGIARGAWFVVVDEGPGLSGSSFLSVAEALMESGAPVRRILLIPSHAPDPSTMRARNAVQRWAKLQCAEIGPGKHPTGDWMGAGEWRRRFSGEREWPGVWAHMERAKFLSFDGQILWRYEGLGPYGTRAREQAKTLAAAGFGVPVAGEYMGYVGYDCLQGTRVRREETDAAVLQRLAAYCDFRAAHFAGEATAAQQLDLAIMLRVNFEREFERALPEAFAELEMTRPMFCDAKMAPHEWLCKPGGELLKLDATSHGDDHFFPGPCDVAWDLAGAMVEWELRDDARDVLLREYRKLSGDDASSRVENYRLAYAVFRFAWSKVAAAAMKGTADEERLSRDYQKYRSYAERIAAKQEIEVPVRAVSS